MEKVKVSEIIIPQGLLPRVLTGTVEEVVQRYMEALSMGEEFPPVKVWKRQEGYWLIDGVHRYHAYKLLGREEIPAVFVECRDELHFRVIAIQENIKHGLPLSTDEVRENARILYQSGLKDVDELARILRRSRSSVYAYVQDLIEEEKQSLRKRILELREKGLSLQQIAEQLGIDKATVSRCCKIPETGKLQHPPSPEDYLSEFFEMVSEEDNLSERWKEYVKSREGAPEGLLYTFSEKILGVIRSLVKAGVRDFAVVEKAILSHLPELRSFREKARKTVLARARLRFNEFLREEERTREKEELILKRAKEVLGDYRYIYTSWQDLAREINPFAPQEIVRILQKHSDELLSFYGQVPEITEEELRLLEFSTEDYKTAQEDVYRKTGKRLPYSLWQKEKETRESKSIMLLNEDVVEGRVYEEGQVPEEVFELLEEDEKRVGITLKGVRREVKKLKAKMEKLIELLQNGDVEKARSIAESVRKGLEDLEEKVETSLSEKSVGRDIVSVAYKSMQDYASMYEQEVGYPLPAVEFKKGLKQFIKYYKEETESGRSIDTAREMLYKAMMGQLRTYAYKKDKSRLGVIDLINNLTGWIAKAEEIRMEMRETARTYKENREFIGEVLKTLGGELWNGNGQ
ncbi:MAG: helix-turn-helix domain-containing protein [Archaeoglobaceae archaeon]